MPEEADEEELCYHWNHILLLSVSHTGDMHHLDRDAKMDQEY